MTQYLLSVHHAENGTVDTRRRRRWRQVFAQVDAFNKELQATASWVFGGGLQPPPTATVVDATGTDAVITPTARTPRPRSTWAASGSSRPPTSTPPWRSPAAGPPPAWDRSRSGRSSRSERLPRHHVRTRPAQSSVPSTVASWPAWPAGSATSTWPRTPPVRPCWSRPSAGPSTGVPPNPGGWLTTVAARKALDRLRREKRRQDKYAEVARRTNDWGTTHPSQRVPWRTTGSGWCSPAATPRWRRRTAWRSPCACSAASLSPNRRGVPGARDHDGAADHPLEAEDQGRGHPLPDPAGPGPAGTAGAVLA